jgi:hypothetical protein
MLTMSTYCGAVISLSAESAMDDAQHRLAQRIKRVSWSREPSRTVSLSVSMRTDFAFGSPVKILDRYVLNLIGCGIIALASRFRKGAKTRSR